MLLADMPPKLRRSARARGFRWPRERMFLSGGAANHRAFLLEWFGAKVIVQPSEPVTWWEDTDGADWYPEDDEDWELPGWLDEVARFSEPKLPPSPESLEQGAEPLDAVPRPRPGTGDILREQAALYARYARGVR
jgi:hypothetical protein